MNHGQLVARLSARVNGLEKKLEIVEQTYPAVLEVVRRLIEERDDTAAAIARVEAYTFGLVTMLLRKQVMTYAELSGAMSELGQAEDLLVLWGVHTEEESRALREAATADAEAKNEEEAIAPSSSTPGQSDL